MYSGDGVAATLAQLNDVEGLALDTDGNLYIADWQRSGPPHDRASRGTAQLRQHQAGFLQRLCDADPA